MSQYLLSLSDEQWAIVDRALADLEAQLVPVITLDGDQRSDPGDSDEPGAFCPQTMEGPAWNLARGAQLAEARSGLGALDRLRTRLQRLQRLGQYARDTEVIVVNDALNCTLTGYVPAGVSRQATWAAALVER